jgi:hypothetical protein
MPNQSIPLNQVDSTIPAAVESGKGQERLNRLAEEIGKANWTDGAGSRPRSRYSYDVVER